MLLSVALASSALGGAVINPVFADSHTSQPVAAPISLGYESALTGYKALDGTERKAWKQSNDTVGQIGGWRSYANEAYQANQAEAKARKDSEDLAAGSTSTSISDTDDKHMEPSRVSSDNMDIDPTMEKSDEQMAKRLGSQPLILTYQSVISTYRLYDDNPPGGWKAANDRVGEIGGWKTYAKEAYEANKRQTKAEATPGNTQ